MNVIIPIGGVGKRFSDDGYTLPKPLIKSLGKSIIFWNIENLNLSQDDIVYIVYREEFKKYNFENLLQNKFRKIRFEFISIQNDTRGASETVLYALDKMESNIDDLTIIVDSDNFYNDDIISISKSVNDNLIFYKKDYDKNPIYSYILDIDGIVIDIKEKEKISDNACVGAYCFKSGRELKDSIKSVLVQDIKQKNEYYVSSIYKFLLENKVTIKSHEINDFICLGTPNQLKTFSSNLNQSNEKYRFCFDLDNTLVTYPEISGDYSSVKPLSNTINFLNFLHSLGHTIIIHTARRMRTHGGNVGKVQVDIGMITIETLNKFGIKYDELYFGKPYAHFYIDDLSIKPFDNLEKETGFYNVHPETRSHNRIEIFDNYIIKYSTSIEGERYYYENIPSEFKYLFPSILESGEDYIKLEKIHGIPISFLNVNNTLTEKILLKILYEFYHLHQNSIEIENINIYSNYYDKVLNRIKSYDFSSYENFETTSSKILEFLRSYEDNKSGRFGIIHGDPVFTNILIDTKDNLKMIDMRGKIGNVLTIYGDIFYDYAKIYQSLIGYDHILMGKEIDTEFLNKNIEVFDNFIIQHYGVENLINIKNITNSLLLSLIPLHDNDKCIKYYNLINGR